MKRSWLWAAVLLPLMVSVGGIVRGELRRSVSELWYFDVTGFDPRDPIHGQYLLFNLDFHLQADQRCAPGDEMCCYCLRRTGDEDPPLMSATRCNDATRENCDGILAARVLSNFQRFYIPEQQARDATDRLQSAAQRGTARAVLAIDPSGRPEVRTLTVDGQPLLR